MRRALLAAGALAWLTACPSSEGTGAYCTRASDCTTPLVCALGRCRVQCATSRDCPVGARCLADATTGDGVCSLASVDDCQTHDCAVGLACAGGRCVNACTTGTQCPDGTCTAGRCTAAPEDDAGLPPADGGAGQSTTWTITLADDADDGEIVDGRLRVDGETSDDDWAGSWSALTTWTFVRYALPGAIPAGAHVLDARLTTTAGVPPYAGTCMPADAETVVAIDLADAPPVTAAGEEPGGLAGRPSTTATVAWGPATAWVVGTNRSPDLSAIVQELVDAHAGLSSGAHVAFWIGSHDLTHDCEVGWRDLGPGGGGAELSLTWAPP